MRRPAAELEALAWMEIRDGDLRKLLDADADQAERNADRACAATLRQLAA